MGEDLGDNRDPLLVRPFVLPDGATQEPPASASTWPVEQRAGELPTQLLPLVPPTVADRSDQDRQELRRRRGLLLLIGAGVASFAVIAGYTMLRPADRSDSWASTPGQSLPVAVGPTTPATVPTSSAPAIESGSGSDSGSGTGNGSATGATNSADGAGKATPTTTAPRASSPLPVGGDSAGTSTSPSAAATGSTTAVPPQPIQLVPDLIATGRGLLVTGNGLCLDLRGGIAVDGGDVHVDDCNGTSPQRWQLNADRTLKVLDMCAYVVGDGTVELTRCDGRTTAQWQLFGNGALINAASAQCLTDPDSGARPGRPVTVTACSGASNQRWAFR